jgi:hypothetical protein
MAAIGAAPFAAIIFLAPAVLPIVLGRHWVGAAGSVSILAVNAYLWFIVAAAGTVPLIVDARRYIVFYQCLRLAALAGLGAAARYGNITYETWLALFVAATAFHYLLEAVAGWFLARNAEASWRVAADA